jgi:hypothetical protein
VIHTCLRLILASQVQGPGIVACLVDLRPGYCSDADERKSGVAASKYLRSSLTSDSNDSGRTSSLKFRGIGEDTAAVMQCVANRETRW